MSEGKRHAREGGSCTARNLCMGVIKIPVESVPNSGSVMEARPSVACSHLYSTLPFFVFFLSPPLFFSLLCLFSVFFPFLSSRRSLSFSRSCFFLLSFLLSGNLFSNRLSLFVLSLLFFSSKEKIFRNWIASERYLIQVSQSLCFL